MVKDKNPKRQKILELVMQHVKGGGNILEISCGKGETLKRLQDEGYIVRGTNYSLYIDACKDVEMDFGVDINSGLPYDNGFFECVILSDVIEHFPNHVAAIKEISRVVKTGGYVLVLTPNTMKISSRLHFLLTGFFKIKRAFIGFDVPADKAFVFHNNPPHLPIFLYQLHSHFLELAKIDGVAYKLKSYLYWLIFAPIIYASTYLKTHITERNLKGEHSSSSLFKSLTSFQTLCAEYWVTVSKKADPATRSNLIKTKLPAWVEKS